MTATFQTDSNQDLFVDPTTGNIAIARDLQAVLQQCEEAVTTVQGELIYSNAGIDYEGTVFTGSPNVVKFNRQARRELLRVPDVQNVDFSSSLVVDELTYQATITTTFGTGAISSGV